MNHEQSPTIEQLRQRRDTLGKRLNTYRRPYLENLQALDLSLKSQIIPGANIYLDVRHAKVRSTIPKVERSIDRLEGSVTDIDLQIETIQNQELIETATDHIFTKRQLRQIIARIRETPDLIPQYEQNLAELDEKEKTDESLQKGIRLFKEQKERERLEREERREKSKEAPAPVGVLQPAPIEIPVPLPVETVTPAPEPVAAAQVPVETPATPAPETDKSRSKITINTETRELVIAQDGEQRTVSVKSDQLWGVVEYLARHQEEEGVPSSKLNDILIKAGAHGEHPAPMRIRDLRLRIERPQDLADPKILKRVSIVSSRYEEGRYRLDADIVFDGEERTEKAAQEEIDTQQAAIAPPDQQSATPDASEVAGLLPETDEERAIDEGELAVLDGEIPMDAAPTQPLPAAPASPGVTYVPYRPEQDTERIRSFEETRVLDAVTSQLYNSWQRVKDKERERDREPEINYTTLQDELAETIPNRIKQVLGRWIQYRYQAMELKMLVSRALPKLKDEASIDALRARWDDMERVLWTRISVLTDEWLNGGDSDFVAHVKRLMLNSKREN